VGTLDNRVFQVLVLEDDEVWAFDGETVGSAFIVQGFLQGQGLSNNGTFRSTSARDFSPGASTSVPISATFTPGTRIEGTVTRAGQQFSFAATGFAAATYNYGSAAALAGIAGTWTLLDPTRASGRLVIQANGNYAATINATGGACSFAGQFAPRSSGKNVFDVDMSFAGTGCEAMANKVLGGIAYMQSLTGTGKQLILAGVTARRDSGAVFFGTR
jgi:hypothetical protein